MYRVYIVDDESEIRRGLVHFFPWNMLGYEIAGQAENGKQALDDLLKCAGTVDVLLTDIKMPFMDGIELIRRLKESGIHLKVVLLSAYSDFEYARDGLKLGVVDYILKPTEYHNLIETFQKLANVLDSERCDVLPTKAETPRSFRQQLVQTVQQYLRLNHATANLEDSARFVHISASYLSTLFKEETGMAFTAYLIDQKMEHAAKLMQDITYKTYEISEIVGYSNAKNFTRTFRKHFGLSPREYRNQLGNAQQDDS